MKKQYITYAQGCAIAETGLWEIEQMEDDDTIYYDCPNNKLTAVESHLGVAKGIAAQNIEISVCPRFTLDEAVQWFREHTGIHIQMNSVERKRWSYDLCDINEWTDENGEYYNCIPERDGYPVFDSFEEAVSDAIDKALGYDFGVTATHIVYILDKNEKFRTIAENLITLYGLDGIRIFYSQLFPMQQYGGRIYSLVNTHRPECIVDIIEPKPYDAYSAKYRNHHKPIPGFKRQNQWKRIRSNPKLR